MATSTHNAGHLTKLRKEKTGAHNVLQRDLEEVLSKLKEFPSTLNLQDQALFALGYYHQRVKGWVLPASVGWKPLLHK